MASGRDLITVWALSIHLGLFFVSVLLKLKTQCFLEFSDNSNSIDSEHQFTQDCDSLEM